MTGLEKIIQEIRDEAAKEAAAVVESAKAQAADIVAAAKAESAAKAAAAAASTDADVADIERGRESAIALQRRQRTLQTKQEMLAETLQKALDSLYALPDAEYFVLLVKLAGKEAQPGKGEMLLNAKDLARLPEGFEDALKKVLKPGSELTVSKNTRPIDGGFVLKYGDVEQNCSFSAIFAARREEFLDKIQGVLFA